MYILFQKISKRLAKVFPSSFILFLYGFLNSLMSSITFVKWRNFSPDVELIDKSKKNLFMFGIHPYTIKITENGLNNTNQPINLITFGSLFSLYENLGTKKIYNTFSIQDRRNFDHYRLAGIYARKKYNNFFKYIDAGVCDFFLPLQFFDPKKKRIVYLNHRFCYNHFFNIYQISDWVKYINYLSHQNNVLLASNHFDYVYYSYFLGNKKDIYLVHPIIDDISDYYTGINDEILIVPGKEKIFVQRENLMDICINQLEKFGINNVYKITERYKAQKYEFSDIAKYKALVVMPYTVYTGSINDFLEMGMPMFFPSAKLLAKRHKDHNLLAEYNCTSISHSFFGKNIFQGGFHKQLNKKLHLDSNIINPLDDSLSSLEFWIGQSDWYTIRPVITFSSFDELAELIKKTDLKAYSKQLLQYNHQKKEESKCIWSNVMNQIIF